MASVAHRLVGRAAQLLVGRRMGMLCVRLGMRLGGCFHHRVADVLGDRLAGTVEAAVDHPAAELVHRGSARVVGDVRRLAHRVGLHVDHPGAPPDRRLDDGELGGPQHSGGFQHNRGLPLVHGRRAR